MKTFIITILLLPLLVPAQEEMQVVRKGLLSGKGTLAIGRPYAFSGTNMYINANMDYYVSPRVSCRGGVSFFLGTSGAPDMFSMNSSLFTGYYYHLKMKGNFDPYVGLEPGLTWSRLKKPADGAAESLQDHSSYPRSVNPVASMTIGLNYYASAWTHLFAEVKYVHGKHISDIPAVPLDEVRLAFGFGFNIQTAKKPKHYGM